MSVFLRDLKRFLLVAFGGFLMALNIVIFVQSADLFPGGLTGITLLLQNIFLKYFNIHLPYSITVYAFNLIPVWIGFKFIGKRFTFFSVVMIFISGLFTDILSGFEWLHLTDDILLCTVFGGILNAVSVVLCLFAESSSGGTDFIAIYISEKTGRSAWNLIFGFNCIVLFFAGSRVGCVPPFFPRFRSRPLFPAERPALSFTGAPGVFHFGFPQKTTDTLGTVIVSERGKIFSINCCSSVT